MNFMHHRLLSLIVLVCGVSAYGQINPVKDITWLKMSGSAAPSGGLCTSANYGQPFTDSTHNIVYFCGVSGWFTLTGSTGITATSPLTTNTIPVATGAASAQNSSITDDATNVATTEPVNSPAFVGTDTSKNGLVNLGSVGTLPTSLPTSTVQVTVPNAVTAYRLVLPGVAPTAGNGVLSCSVPVSSVSTCSWIPNLDSVGTAFSVSGACSASTPTGGQISGEFKSGTAGACVVTITMGDSQTATNGWVCGSFTDVTTNADSSSWQQTASTTTTATFSGTTALNDFVQFGCIKR